LPDSIEETKQPGGEGGSDDGNYKSYNLRAFMSTPLFFESLTDLSVRILREKDN